MSNIVNTNFISSVCSSALNGINAINAAGSNAIKYSAYFGGSGILTQNDFIGQYSNLNPTFIGNAVASIAAINSTISSNSNLYANYLTKVARSSTSFGQPFITQRSNQKIVPTPSQMASGTKPANVKFVADVVSTASVGLDALTNAIGLSNQYQQYFSNTLASGDFVGQYNDLTPTDIHNAMTAIGAVETTLNANNNTYLNALLTIAI